MRHVVQDPPPAAAARRHDPAVRAALQLPRRRDRHRHRRLGPLDRLDMDRRQAEQHVTARTRVGSGGRVGAPRSVGQRRGPRGRSVVGASDHRGPRPLHPARHGARTTPHQIGEEPDKPETSMSRWRLGRRRGSSPQRLAHTSTGSLRRRYAPSLPPLSASTGAHSFRRQSRLQGSLLRPQDSKSSVTRCQPGRPSEVQRSGTLASHTFTIMDLGVLIQVDPKHLWRSKRPAFQTCDTSRQSTSRSYFGLASPFLSS